jgi:hypothetical protein
VKEMNTMKSDGRKVVPAVNIEPDHPFQTARALKTKFGLAETTLRKLALGGLIRHETTTAVVSLYNVEDVAEIVRQKGRIPAAQPQMSEAK